MVSSRVSFLYNSTYDLVDSMLFPVLSIMILMVWFLTMAFLLFLETSKFDVSWKMASTASGCAENLILDFLDAVRESIAVELRNLRHNKYGWILHAESEWSEHIQQLVHERGLWPMVATPVDGEPTWQLCVTEGPFRMRKKLERQKINQGDILLTNLEVCLLNCVFSLIRWLDHFCHNWHHIMGDVLLHWKYVIEKYRYCDTLHECMELW